MARVLVAARKRVAEPDRAAYRRVVAELAARFEARGQHLWVFRSPDDPGLVLEFREASSPEALAPADDLEAALDRRVESLAAASQPPGVWEEWPPV